MTNELTERKKKIERLIPDNGVRNLIFDFGESSSGFLSNKRNYIEYVKTTLYFVVLIAYKKFVDYKFTLEKKSLTDKTQEVSAFSNAMVRLYNMLDGCYSSGRLDFELVENVILNLQVDAAMNCNHGFLENVGMQRYFNFSFLGNDLSKYIFSLKKSMLSSRYVPDFEFDDLLRFFTSFPFLLNARLEYCDLDHCSQPLHRVLLRIGDETLDMGNLLIEYAEQFNYLYGVSMTDPRKFTADDPFKAQIIRGEYVPFRNSGDFEVVFSDDPLERPSPRTVLVTYDTAVEDFLLSFRLLNLQNGKGDNLFRDFFFVDNKYIKYLALTISDLINAESKRKVYEYYGKKYGAVFKKLSGAQVIRWDEIIVFLLLEVGIYNLLTYLFKNTNLSYGEVKEAFRLRFGENVAKLEKQIQRGSGRAFKGIFLPPHYLQTADGQRLTFLQVELLYILSQSVLTFEINTHLSADFPRHKNPRFLSVAGKFYARLTLAEYIRRVSDFTQKKSTKKDRLATVLFFCFYAKTPATNDF